MAAAIGSHFDGLAATIAEKFNESADAADKTSVQAHELLEQLK